MPTIPTYESQVNRTSQAPGVMIPEGATGQVGAAIAGAGDKLFNLGLEYAKRQKQIRDAQQYMDSNTNAMTDMFSKQDELTSAPEWNLNPEGQVAAFKKYAESQRHAYLSGISDPKVRMQFQANYDRMYTSRLIEITGKARLKRNELYKASVFDNLDKLKDIAATAENDVDFQTAYTHAMSYIDGAVAAGAIPADYGVKMKETWTHEAGVEMVNREIQNNPVAAYKALKNTKDKTFNFLHEADRQKLLSVAEAAAEKQTAIAEAAAERQTADQAYNQAITEGTLEAALKSVDALKLPGKVAASVKSEVNAHFEYQKSIKAEAEKEAAKQALSSTLDKWAAGNLEAKDVMNSAMTNKEKTSWIRALKTAENKADTAKDKTLNNMATAIISMQIAGGQIKSLPDLVRHEDFKYLTKADREKYFKEIQDVKENGGLIKTQKAYIRRSVNWFTLHLLNGASKPTADQADQINQFTSVMETQARDKNLSGADILKEGKKLASDVVVGSKWWGLSDKTEPKYQRLYESGGDTINAKDMATQILQQNGKPVTEANIKAVMDRLRTMSERLK